MQQDDKAQREKAYNRGCMVGMAGGDSGRCPYNGGPLAQWWQQGWEDGTAARAERLRQQSLATAR